MKGRKCLSPLIPIYSQRKINPRLHSHSLLVRVTLVDLYQDYIPNVQDLPERFYSQSQFFLRLT